MSEELRSPSQDPSNQITQDLNGPEQLKFQKELMQSAEQIIVLAKDKAQPFQESSEITGQQIRGKEVFVDLKDMMIHIELYDEGSLQEDSQDSNLQPLLKVSFLRKFNRDSDGIVDATVLADGDLVKVNMQEGQRVVDRTNNQTASEVSSVLSEILNNPDIDRLILDADTGADEFAELSMEPGH